VPFILRIEVSSRLLLEKTQIHQINRKDIVDLIVLFLGYGVSTSPQKENINGKYVAETLANDWGSGAMLSPTLRKS